jgi:Uncharacterized protein containing a NRPS condensation (elongation) domain
VEVPGIELHDGESFAEILARVKEAMDEIKHNLPGIPIAAGVELMAEMNHSALRSQNQQMHAQLVQMSMAMPILTNFGIIAEYPIRFGALVVEEAYMTPPIMYAPYFLMGASSYNGVLTLSIGFHTPATSEEEINRFLDDMVGELTFRS